VAGLDDLLIDREQVNEELLREVLLPYIGIDADRKEIVPKQQWNSLNADRKVLIYLLARKAMVVLPTVQLEIEGALPKDIEDSTGIPGGTLRPKLRNLKRLGLLTQDREGRYYVPSHALSQMNELLKEDVIGNSRNSALKPARSRGPRKSTRRKVPAGSVQDPG
jgi:hypothetical protein